MSTTALIFDCDGVLADTERDGHLVAFNAAFAEVGLSIRWSDEQYKHLLGIGGGKERLQTILTDPEVKALIRSKFDSEQSFIQSLHRVKTDRYTELIASGALPARPGVRRLAAEAHAGGWRLAVASTSAEASVRAVLTHVMGETLASEFAVLAGDIVPRKKPAPHIYLAALKALGVDARNAIAVEDSAIGMRAAIAAKLRTVITTSSYTAGEDFTGAVAVFDCLGDLPDVPATTAADPAGLDLGLEISLADLEKILAATPQID